MDTLKAFASLDIRIGTIIDVKNFDAAKVPAYIIHVDFGSLGILKTSAQLTENYTPEKLMHNQITAVVNLPTKQIGPIMSECLILGILDEKKGTVLVVPDSKVENGSKIA